MDSETHAHVSPLSPVERDLTAVMPPQGDDAASAADFPHNASSWELLDIVAASSTAMDGAGLSQTTGRDAQTNEVNVVAGLIKITDLNEGATPSVTANSASVVHQSAVTSDGAATLAAVAAVVAEISGRVSPARTASSEWSLVSTPSESHLPCDAKVTNQPLTISVPGEQNSDPLCNAAATSADKGVAEESATTRRTQLPAAEVDVSQTFSIASPPPSPVLLTHASTSVLFHATSNGGAGWSTTSYEEVCMNDVLRSGGPATRIVSCAVSACTTPSPLRSGTSYGHVSLGPQVAESGARENSVQELENAPYSAAVCADAVADTANDTSAPPSERSAAASQEPSTAQLMSWLFKARDALHEPEAKPSGDATVNTPNSSKCSRLAGAATTWSARRLSFLSSSTATIALSATMIPRTSLSGYTDVTAALYTTCSNSSRGAHSPSPSPSPISPSHSYQVTWAAEAAQWCWSRTRVVCADGSQQALRGLHTVCDYVWRDLKHHWYPQLRLVLGDHTCAPQDRRVRRARRRLTHKKTVGGQKEEEATTTATVMPRWRSVSAPCLLQSDQDSAPLCGQHDDATSRVANPSRHRRARNKNTDVCVEGNFSDSKLHGLRLCCAVTADAVASAAQGLLVFLL